MVLVVSIAQKEYRYLHHNPIDALHEESTVHRSAPKEAQSPGSALSIYRPFAHHFLGSLSHHGEA